MVLVYDNGFSVSLAAILSKIYSSVNLSLLVIKVPSLGSVLPSTSLHVFNADGIGFVLNVPDARPPASEVCLCRLLCVGLSGKEFLVHIPKKVPGSQAR